MYMYTYMQLACVYVCVYAADCIDGHNAWLDLHRAVHAKLLKSQLCESFHIANESLHIE